MVGGPSPLGTPVPWWLALAAGGGFLMSAATALVVRGRLRAARGAAGAALATARLGLEWLYRLSRQLAAQPPAGNPAVWLVVGERLRRK